MLTERSKFAPRISSSTRLLCNRFRPLCASSFSGESDIKLQKKKKEKGLHRKQHVVHNPTGSVEWAYLGNIHGFDERSLWNYCNSLVRLYLIVVNDRRSFCFVDQILPKNSIHWGGEISCIHGSNSKCGWGENLDGLNSTGGETFVIIETTTLLSFLIYFILMYAPFPSGLVGKVVCEEEWLVTKQMKALHALSSFVPKLDTIEASVKLQNFQSGNNVSVTEMFETL